MRVCGQFNAGGIFMILVYMFLTTKVLQSMLMAIFASAHQTVFKNSEVEYVFGYVQKDTGMAHYMIVTAGLTAQQKCLELEKQRVGQGSLKQAESWIYYTRRAVELRRGTPRPRRHATGLMYGRCRYITQATTPPSSPLL